MNEDEFIWFGSFYESSNYLKLGKLETQEADKIADIHARIYSHKRFKPCSCSPKIWKQWINDILKVYKTY